MTLSPTRREESRRGLVGLDEGLLDFLRHNIDDPEVNKVLLDPELHAQVLGEQAGAGYRQVVIPQTKSGKPGTPQLVPEQGLPMSDLERDMVDVNSLIRQIDYDSTGQTREIDDSHQIYKLLEDFVDSTGQSGITDTAKKGIRRIKHSEYGYRDNHPSLPALDRNTAKQAVINQLLDNLFGNRFGVQPSGMVNSEGVLSGIPVEHLISFNSNPELGYDPNNRDLGSALVNSIVRDESDPSTRRDLLVSHLIDRIHKIENNTGKSFSDVSSDMGYYPATSPVQRMAQNILQSDKVDKIKTGSVDATNMKRFAASPAVQDLMQEIEAGRDAQTAGAVVGRKPLVVNVGPGGKAYLHTNGNGNGNGHANVQKAFDKQDYV